MKPVSGRIFANIVERHGWVLLRVKGSHNVYGKVGSPVRLSFPTHRGRLLKVGLLNHLMKLAGLDESDLR